MMGPSVLHALDADEKALTFILGNSRFIRRGSLVSGGPRTIIQNGSSPALPEPGEIVSRVRHHVARLLQ
ncbi:unnamed protein product [Acanthoscelides obtectus]|uniref:Uncharacterized protein n=1 Tax=Acanthoscelides obtectus TaxID=200917 RepID=A0A9P0JMK3_ACAOB|nr:unnamed protein product [Acanthoscelides obtectus]CAK1665776.1 hypothetical protein AOBTE_LOCUS24962 [Acanthoscelides obtectus]